MAWMILILVLMVSVGALVELVDQQS